MNYIAITGIGLVGGVIGHLVSLGNQNPVFAKIVAAIAVAGFAAACVWSISHVARIRRRSDLDS